jgi:iron complex transport system ATP-binding protein
VGARERRQGRAILRRVEAEYLADRPWRYLSQGERQRILIGRALMAEPELLILDEPCAGLDPVARERFLSFVERLAHGRDAPAMVLVTHHVEEIMPVFSHILLLRRGRVLAAGERARVMRSAVLAEAFDAPVRLRSSAGRYSLAVAAKRGVVT